MPLPCVLDATDSDQLLEKLRAGLKQETAASANDISKAETDGGCLVPLKWAYQRSTWTRRHQNRQTSQSSARL